MLTTPEEGRDGGGENLKTLLEGIETRPTEVIHSKLPDKAVFQVELDESLCRKTDRMEGLTVDMKNSVYELSK